MGIKEFKTYDEQLKILKNKGLIISDEGFAKDKLEKENYYNLINGYKTPFLDKTKKEEKFVADTKFEYIYELYDYHKSLKDLILKYILQFETMFRSILAYEFAKAHNPYCYEDETVYNRYDPSHKINKAAETEIQNVIAIIKEIVTKASTHNDKKNDCIKHYVSKHKKVPIWIICNFMTFGDIIRFYEILMPKVKLAISNRISEKSGEKLSPKQLKIYLNILREFRNICAHGNRLYTYMPFTQLSYNNTVVKQNNKTPKDYNNISSLFVAFIYTIDKYEQYTLKSEVLSILQKILKELKDFSQAQEVFKSIHIYELLEVINYNML